jgi:exosortase E/protease (VPEID-CTERM system)
MARSAVSTTGDSSSAGRHPEAYRINYLRYAVWAVLVGMLVAEMVALRLPYDSRADFPHRSFGAQLLLFFQQSVEPTFTTALVVASFLSIETLREELRRVSATDGRGLVSWPWLLIHLGFLAPLIAGTIARQQGHLSTVGAWEGWLLLWAILGCGALVAWCFAILPPVFWMGWVRRSRSAFIIAGTIGFAAFTIGHWARNLWWPLQRSTFETVDFLLHFSRLQTIVLPDEFVIGTTNFAVSIDVQCSGLEGIGLIAVMTAAYLWYYRHDLHFPQALLLIPAGALAMWLVNAMRIAVLVVIGSWSSAAAVAGFHSVAGWLLFNLVACGLIWMTTRLRLFARSGEELEVTNPAVMYLLPFLILITFAIVTHAFKPAGNWLYPLGAVVAGGVIAHYRAELCAMAWQVSWPPIVAGAAVCTFWIFSGSGDVLTNLLLERGDVPDLGSSLLSFGGLAIGSLAMAIAEELAFRGYLMRRLVAQQFENVSRENFAWWSLISSSVVYGLIHTHWPAATIVGMIFAGVMYYRGRLSDAIIAHLTAAILLFGYAVAS